MSYSSVPNSHKWFLKIIIDTREAVSLDYTFPISYLYVGKSLVKIINVKLTRPMRAIIFY